MKFLHTSDWHLGRALYGRARHEEQAAFLDWLLARIEAEAVDALLVAGDVFDTGAPSPRAQELYYRFLGRVAGAGCRHVLIIAGNHDSPAFLNAPRAVLHPLNIHVVGSAMTPAEEEVILLGTRDAPEAIVCAVPYLREKDVRIARSGENAEDKERNTLAGIREHYDRVFAAALALRDSLAEPVPIIAAGHLFTSGGRTVEGDGVRDLYVGSLGHVRADMFPPFISYLALGHLHTPQTVAGRDHLRYSGAPLPMSFSEAGQGKQVLLVQCSGTDCRARALEVPVFQPLEQIRGDWEHIARRLEQLVQEGSAAWLEILHQGDEVLGDVRARVDELTEGSALAILRVRGRTGPDRAADPLDADERLADLDHHDIFARCLIERRVPPEQRQELSLTYQELMLDFHARDQEEPCAYSACASKT